MAEFPIPEMAAIPEAQSSKKGQFGVPSNQRSCGSADLRSWWAWWQG